VNDPETVHAVGFAYWKRRHVRTFLTPAKVRFVAATRDVPPGSTAASWGMRIPDEVFPAQTRLLRLEDGFLRSVGLGADLTTPLSWVADGRGIYYDPSRPSDLEHLLARHNFTGSEIDRGRALRARIVSAGITKYNCDAAPWRRPGGAKRVILVPGQVDSDASVRLGTDRFSCDRDLLRAVRETETGAFIVYKPHPDVAASLRRSSRIDKETAGWCDAVAAGCDMNNLLGEVDEVHTMTSLTGFEALLRGVKVVTYGTPFYAGWGLTEDRDMRESAARRRDRRLSLDELVSASLVLYPRYADRRGCALHGPEQALDELVAWRAAGPPGSSLLRPILRLLAR